MADDVRHLLDDLETTADVDDASQNLQTLIMGLRPSKTILQEAGAHDGLTQHPSATCLSMLAGMRQCTNGA